MTARSTAVRAAKFHALLVDLRGHGWLLREIADLTGLGEPNVHKHLRGQCRCLRADRRHENGYQPREIKGPAVMSDGRKEQSK
jgi:hypothetical protein